MKKHTLFIAVLTVASVVMASQSVMGYLYPTIGSIFHWESTMHDFGNITQSTAVEHKFTFTNKGDIPLIISTVKASCGCTVAEYTREAIAPGEEGTVSARYDAAKIGAFTKTVTVTANTGAEAVVLTLKGNVVAPE